MPNHGLAQAAVVACNGQITHRLTLLHDGRVEVECGGVRAVVDPGRGVVHPPGYRLPEDVLAAARTLAADGPW